MALTNEGEEYFLKAVLSKAISLPTDYAIGLSQSTAATLGEGVTLPTVNEVTGSGYARQWVTAGIAGWSVAISDGDWQATSIEVTFTATGTWATARSMFLSDGVRVLATLDLSAARTLTNGEHFHCVMKLKQQ